MDENASLFDVTVRRTYTDKYLEKYPSAHRSKSHDTVCLSWGHNPDTIRKWWEEHQRPGRFPSFDKMYRDTVVKVERVSDEDLAERRLRASRYKLCCNLAVLRSCVCLYSTTCPVHGEQCHGSHD